MSRLRGNVEEGDRVSFHDTKGRPRTGIVGRVRLLQRRGRKRELAFRVTGDETSLDQFVAEIVLEGEGNRGYYTVGAGAVRVEDRGAMTSGEARSLLDSRKDAIKEVKSDRFASRVSAIRESGLDSLKPGDPIWIDFTDGREPASFDGIVKGSGRVRFIFRGRKRFTPPKFVSLRSEGRKEESR